MSLRKATQAAKATRKRKVLDRYSYGARRVLGMLCKPSVQGLTFEGLAENLLAQELVEGGLAQFRTECWTEGYFPTEKGLRAWEQWQQKKPQEQK